MSGSVLTLPITPPRGWAIANTAPARSKGTQVISAGVGVGTTAWKELVRVTVPMGTRYYVIGATVEAVDDPNTLQVRCDLWFNGVSILESNQAGYGTNLFTPDGQMVSIYKDVGGGILQLVAQNISGTTETDAAPDALHYLARAEVLGVTLRRGK